MMKTVRERGTRRARIRLAAFVGTVALALGLIAAGIAVAAPDLIVAGPAESFDRQATDTPYSTDQGAVVQFQDNGGTHNVTARQAGPDGKPLFSSPTINGGTAGVNGTQYLTPGDYPFFCTVHPTTMTGTLRVTTNGAPQPRPSATLSIRAKKIAKALKKGISVALNTSAKIDDVSLVAKLGKATIGRASDLSLAQGQVFETIKLSKSGKSKLRKKSTAKVTVTAEIPFGAPASAKAKLK
jgi:plastocyanin